LLSASSSSRRYRPVADDCDHGVLSAQGIGLCSRRRYESAVRRESSRRGRSSDSAPLGSQKFHPLGAACRTSRAPGPQSCTRPGVGCPTAACRAANSNRAVEAERHSTTPELGPRLPPVRQTESTTHHGCRRPCFQPAARLKASKVGRAANLRERCHRASSRAGTSRTSRRTPSPVPFEFFASVENRAKVQSTRLAVSWLIWGAPCRSRHVLSAARASWDRPAHLVNLGA